MNVKEMEEAVFWPTKNVFSHWGEYFKVACPSILLGCPEWWSVGILIFMAGNLGVEEQATQTIIGGLYFLFTTLAMGFNVGACVIIGNKIGANKPHKALYYMGLTAKISISSCFIIILLLFLGR
jgi:Na+-driven multidrug efflux pump